MRHVLALLALLPACGGESVELSVRLSLENGCGSPTDPGTGGGTPNSPANISLACGATVGLFVLDQAGTLLDADCHQTNGTLADVPGLFSSYRSPELSSGMTIRVRLEIEIGIDASGATTCGPSGDDPSGTATGEAPLIYGDSSPTTLDGSTDSIVIPLSCVSTTPCDPTTNT